MVGATSIESDSLRPATVRSALELLSAACAFAPGFRRSGDRGDEGSVPTDLPDHLPRIVQQDNLLRINGLYRHGYLLSPLVAETVATFIRDQRRPAETATLWARLLRARMRAFAVTRKYVVEVVHDHRSQRRKKTLESPRSLADAIRDLGYEGARIAVARNDEFVPRGDYATRQLQDGDRLEIVSPMQGRLAVTDSNPPLWDIGGRQLRSRLLLGTARYPSLAVLQQAIAASGAEIVTVSLRRESATERAGNRFWSTIKAMGVQVLPNTAGCKTVKEAVTTAEMGQEISRHRG